MEEITSQLKQLSVQDKKSIFVYHHPDTLLHRSSKKHPEQPDRVETILSTIRKYPHVNIKNMAEQPEVLSSQDIQTLASELQGDHYVQFIKEMWDPSSNRSEMYINKDTYYSKNTFLSAIAAAKTTVAAIDCLFQHQNSVSFSVVRPPGHHSGLKAQPHGFSFLNNIAIGAHKIIKDKKVKRIAIVDWDVHHGQGTQKIFYNRSDVLYVSLHRFDKGKYFPHISQSGSEFVGQGQGKGFNVNVCWNLPEKEVGKTREADKSVGTEQYKTAFQKIVMPVLEQYNPELILVSCGFDSADGDPYGDLKVGPEGYTYMLSQLLKFAKPVGIVLEGGYDLKVLEWATQALLQSFSQVGQKQAKKYQPHSCNTIGEEGIQECLKNIRPYWKNI